MLSDVAGLYVIRCRKAVPDARPPSGASVPPLAESARLDLTRLSRDSVTDKSFC